MAPTSQPRTNPPRALRQRSSRQITSYREPSTDESDVEVEDDASLEYSSPPPARQSSRLTTKQKRSIHSTPIASYREPSTDGSEAEDETALEYSSPPPTRPSSRRITRRTTERKRSIRSTQIASYREASTDGELDLEYSSPQTYQSSNHTTKRKRSTISVSSSDSEDSSNEYTPRKRRIATRSPPTPTSTKAIVHCALNKEKIPNWTSLPYDILCQIFDYASSLLCNERLEPYASARRSSVHWLLETSRVCTKFTEPCLSVLYQCPPLAPMGRAHGLVQHLKADQNAMSMNYRNKIESIRFEVTSTAAYSYAGQGTLDLHGLIRNAPRLRDLEIYHEKDEPPFRELGVPIKWSYPDALFEALAERWNEEVEEQDWKTSTMVTRVREHGPIKLRSWRWSSRLAGEKQSLDNMVGIHLTPSFNDLKKITFVNYQKPKLRKGQVDPDHEAKLAEAIGALPNLQHLVFESCPLVNSKLLPLLPGTLQILEVINCSELDADDMTAFLVSKGGHLRELILNHNQSLSLSFMPVLASACPRLEILRTNFNYYNVLSTAWESEPNYDRLLHIEEVPTWPSSLRIIDLHQLRHWDIDTAEMFFTSIVNSSAQLPHLRQLTIKAILTTGWKIRAEFRTKWIDMMEKVFLSRRPDPNPTWTSIEAYQAQKGISAASEEEEIEEVDDDDDDDDDILIRRPQLRRQQGPVESEALQSRRSTGLRLGDPAPLVERKKRSTRSHITYAEPETSDESASEDESVLSTNSGNVNFARCTRQTKRGELPSPPHTGSNNTQSGSEGDQPSARAALNMARMSRELANLYATAGQRPKRSGRPVLPSSPPASDSDSDDEPLLKKKGKGKPASDFDSDDEPLLEKRDRGKGKGKGKAVQALHVPPFVQGMCDLVKVCCDNIRPREDQFSEGDFLDSEPDDDSEWDGDDRIPGDEEIAF